MTTSFRIALCNFICAVSIACLYCFVKHYEIIFLFFKLHIAIYFVAWYSNDIPKKESFVAVTSVVPAASSVLPALMTGCLYEHPVMTEDGEIGIDPTSVTLNAKLKLNLKMPAAEEGGEALLRPEAGESPQYRHRFIIDAYLNRICVARQVIYQDIANGRDELTIPVNMKLHARNYEIAVWSDYVQMPNEENDITGTEDYFYNPTDNFLLTVYGSESYRSNNEYKDAFCGMAQLNLEEYRDKWNTQVSLNMELTRPVMRYQLVANDVQKFLKLF